MKKGDMLAYGTVKELEEKTGTKSLNDVFLVLTNRDGVDDRASAISIIHLFLMRDYTVTPGIAKSISDLQSCNYVQAFLQRRPSPHPLPDDCRAGLHR